MMRVAMVISLLTTAACGGSVTEDYDGPTIGCEGIEKKAAAIVDSRCAACHLGPGARGGFDVRDTATLVSRGAERIALGTMPPSGPLSPVERETIRTWAECIE